MSESKTKTEFDSVFTENEDGNITADDFRDLVASTPTLEPASDNDNLIVATGNYKTMRLRANAGQTEPLLVFEDEDGDEVGTIEVDGSFTGSVSSFEGGIAQDQVTDLVTDLGAKEDASNKNQNGGYAGLDEDGIVQTADIPQSLVTDLVQDLDDRQLTSEKDQPNGYPGLDSNGDLVGVLIPRHDTLTNLSGIVLEAGEFASTTDTHQILVGDGSTAGGVALNSLNSAYVITVQASGTPAQNATALLAGYAAAKILTPGGSALSATNRAQLVVMPGRYDFHAITSQLVLDTAYLDVIGMGGSEVVTLVTYNDASLNHNIHLDKDNITLQGFTIKNTNSGGSQTEGAIRFNAGAGGSYSSTNSGTRHVDLNYDTGTASRCVDFNTSITSFGGTYKRITTNNSNLYTTYGCTLTTCNPTFEDCVVTGGQPSGLMGGCFGGNTSGGAQFAQCVPFTGLIRRCFVTAAIIGIINRGRIEYCRFYNNQTNDSCVFAGNAGKFYFNYLRQSTTTKYTIGYAETASCQIGHNVLRANGIDTTDHSGSTITNLVDSTTNIMDDDITST